MPDSKPPRTDEHHADGAHAAAPCGQAGPHVFYRKPDVAWLAACCQAHHWRAAWKSCRCAGRGCPPTRRSTSLYISAWACSRIRELTTGIGYFLVIPPSMPHGRDHATGKGGSRDDRHLFPVKSLSVNAYSLSKPLRPLLPLFRLLGRWVIRPVLGYVLAALLLRLLAGFFL